METANADQFPLISTTLRCVRCGYDLRSQPSHGLCPECGLSVGRTRSVGKHLQHGRPGWLNRLCIGTWLLLLVPAAAVASIPCAAMVADRFWFHTSMQDITFYVLCAAPFAVALTHIASIYLLTSREHRFEHQLAGNAVRVVLRFCVLGSLIIAGAITGFVQHNGSTRAVPWADFTVGSFLLLIPTYILTFVYLRTLARRIGHASLAEHCVIVSVGISVSILMSILLSFFAFYFDTDKTILPLLVVLTTAILFGLWSTYLLFRFAVVFHQSASIAKQNWITADAATMGRN
jgi:hypothetical protein